MHKNLETANRLLTCSDTYLESEDSEQLNLACYCIAKAVSACVEFMIVLDSMPIELGQLRAMDLSTVITATQRFGAKIPEWIENHGDTLELWDNEAFFEEKLIAPVHHIKAAYEAAVELLGNCVTAEVVAANT